MCQETSEEVSKRKGPARRRKLGWGGGDEERPADSEIRAQPLPCARSRAERQAKINTELFAKQGRQKGEQVKSSEGPVEARSDGDTARPHGAGHPRRPCCHAEPSRCLGQTGKTRQRF